MEVRAATDHDAIDLTYIQAYTNQDPYWQWSDAQVEDFLFGTDHILPDSSRPQFVDGSFRYQMPQDLWELLKQCWSNAAERPGASDVLSVLDKLQPRRARATS